MTRYTQKDIEEINRTSTEVFKLCEYRPMIRQRYNYCAVDLEYYHSSCIKSTFESGITKAEAIRIVQSMIHGYHMKVQE